MNATLRILSLQHRQALARLTATESQMASAGDLEDFFEYLSLEVTQHFDLEEKALFPALAAYPAIANGPLLVMNDEHADFRKLLRNLGEAVCAPDALRQKTVASAIIALLRTHVAKEDRVLFPTAERILRDEEKKEVDAIATRLGLLQPQAA